METPFILNFGTCLLQPSCAILLLCCLFVLQFSEGTSMDPDEQICTPLHPKWSTVNMISFIHNWETHSWHRSHSYHSSWYYSGLNLLVFRCGLVALWMSAQLQQSKPNINFETVVQTALKRGYTAQGEMFSGDLSI